MNYINLVSIAEKYKSEANIAALLLSINELRISVINQLNHIMSSRPTQSTNMASDAATYVANKDALQQAYDNLAAILKKVAPNEKI